MVLRGAIAAGAVIGGAFVLLAFLPVVHAIPWEPLAQLPLPVGFPAAAWPLFLTGVYAVHRAGRAIRNWREALLAGAIAGATAAVVGLVVFVVSDIPGKPPPILSRLGDGRWDLVSVLRDSPFRVPRERLLLDLPALLPFSWTYARTIAEGVRVSQLPITIPLFFPAGAFLSALQALLYFVLAEQVRRGNDPVRLIARLRASFQSKLLVGFTLVSFIISFVGWQGYRLMEDIHLRVHTGRATQHLLDHVVRVQETLHEHGVVLARLAESPDANAARELARLAQLAEAEVNHLKTVPPPPHAVTEIGVAGSALAREAEVRLPMFREVDARLAELRRGVAEMAAFLAEGNVPAAQARAASLLATQRAAEAAVGVVAGDINRALVEWMAQSDDQSHSQEIFLLLLMAPLATLLAIVLGQVFAQVVVRPVHQVNAALTRIGAGDFSTRVRVENHDELGQLAGQVNRMSEEVGRLTAAIEQERATLAAVMASMSDGLLVLDAGQRVRYSNARAAALLETTSRTLVGLTAEAVIESIDDALVDPEATRATWMRAFAAPSSQPSFELGTLSPRRRDVQVQVFSVVDEGGASRGAGVILRDVTEQHDLQRTKDELVSVVSHELRTPLASLVGFAELLLTRDHLEVQRRRFLTIMLEEGRRLTALINDFLDLQRLESGRQPLTLAPVDPARLLVRAIEAAGDEPTHPMVLDVPDALPLVNADAERIHQVLANLVSNARKYSPQGGEVRLSARLVDGMLELSVADQGLGLPPDAVPRLFNKFFRVDNSDRRTISGTGLGLAICRQIVEAHGGRIWAESAGLGLGSRFCFTLPLAAAGATGGDVLIVEDDPGFGHLLEAELVVRGMTAVCAGSAAAARAYVSRVRPHAVVLDLLLPADQGEQLLAQLRETGLGPVPVVVVTVKDVDDDERARLGALGAIAVLQKGPQAASRAAEAVRTALAGDAEQPNREEVTVV